MSVRSSVHARTDASQTPYALRILWAHGMCHCQPSTADHLQVTHNRQATLRIQSSACWRAFTKATDRQRVEGFYIAAFAVFTAHLTVPHLLNNLPPLMKNYLKNLQISTISTHCTVSFLLLQLPHRATVQPSTSSAQPATTATFWPSSWL